MILLVPFIPLIWVSYWIHVAYYKRCTTRREKKHATEMNLMRVLIDDEKDRRKKMMMGFIDECEVQGCIAPIRVKLVREFKVKLLTDFCTVYGKPEKGK